MSVALAATFAVAVANAEQVALRQSMTDNDSNESFHMVSLEEDSESLIESGEESVDSSLPWGRTFFARSEVIDITETIVVTQIVRLAKGLPEHSLMKVSSSHPLGTWLQTADPNSHNFVTISPGPDFKWVSVMPKPALLVQPNLTFRLEGRSIEAGEQFEIKFMDLRVPFGDLEGLELPVELSPAGSNQWQRLESETRQLKPGDAVELRIQILEGRESIEAVDVLIQPIDGLGFPTTSEVSSFDLLINNKLYAQVNKVDGSYRASNVLIEQDQLNRFTARSPGGGLRGSEMYDSRSRQRSPRVVWTDFSNASLNALGMSAPPDTLAQLTPDGTEFLAAENLLQDLITAADLTVAQLSQVPVTDLIRIGLLGQRNNAQPFNVISTDQSLPTKPARSEGDKSGDSEVGLNDARRESVSDPEVELTKIQAVSDVAIENPTQIGSEAIESAEFRKERVAHSADVFFDRDIRAFNAGGQILTLSQNQNTITIAQPELTSDRRSVHPELVEQLSGPGGHAWMVDHFAALGDSFGITASRRSFNPRARINSPETAIVIDEDQTLFEALKRGQTYVTTGHRAHLEFKVNGTQWGRSKDQPVRKISIALRSEMPPVWAKIKKNGVQISEQRFTSKLQPTSQLIDSTMTDVPLASQESGTIYLLLESSARPLKPGMTLPRNGREWLGLITLNGMTLKSALAPQMLQVAGTRLQARPSAAQVDFLAWTQGQSALIRIDLERSVSEIMDVETEVADSDAEPGAAALGNSQSDEFQSVQLEIAEGFEDLSFIEPSRPSMATPKFSETFSLLDLKRQRAERDFWVGGYHDRISLWFESATPTTSEATVSPRDYTLFYADTVDPLPGDYYTIEVLLEDGSQLFGSPIFVGGFAEGRSDVSQ
ncbi:MAG: hypothetical protein ACPHUJ_07625 [Pseudomonadales bacterium]